MRDTGTDLKPVSKLFEESVIKEQKVLAKH